MTARERAHNCVQLKCGVVVSGENETFVFNILPALYRTTSGYAIAKFNVCNILQEIIITIVVLHTST